MIFKNREHAGKMLAKALDKYSGQDVIILALPRGGVVLGYEIAIHLNAPLSLAIAQKIGHPFSPEYAIGAISKDGVAIFNEDEKKDVDPLWLKKEIAIKEQEALRRFDTYLQGKTSPSLAGKVVILVDDGLATGLTMRVAIKEVKSQKPKKIVVAVPVSSRDTAEHIRNEVDDLVCLYIPLSLGAIGAFYEEFDQVSDAEVLALLKHFTG